MNHQIMIGDARELAKLLPSDSVHCIVTSPPYYGLRDYQTEPVWWPEITYQPMPGVGELIIPAGKCNLGNEPTIEAYIGHLVAIFRELWRVLRDDGTLWVNIGDSYTSQGGPQQVQTISPIDGAGNTQNGGKSRKPPSELAPKNLMMIPARLALALQADGWWLRSEIVWAKTAPMPESVTDRPTSATEKIYLFAKSSRYFYDQEAERVEPAGYDRKGGTATYTANGFTTNGIGSKSLHQMAPAGRNLWNYWLVSPEPYPGAHFAVFPSELPRRCISLATSARGVCPECGSPWARVVERSQANITNPRPFSKNGNDDRNDTGRIYMESTTTTTGWRPTCAHDLDPIPATVLDPFLGSGTTSIVAKRLGRSSIGFELNQDYAEMAQERIWMEQPPLFVPEAIIETGPEVEQLKLC